MKNSLFILLGLLLILGPLVCGGLTENGVEPANQVVHMANEQGSTTAAWGGLIILAAPCLLGFLFLALGMVNDD